MEIIKIAKLVPNAIIPTRKHADDAGIDLYASQNIAIPALSYTIVSTGITVEIQHGFVGLIKPKGRNNHILGAGVVDAGYQGEILVKVFNPIDHVLQIKMGDAIGQLLVLPILTPSVMEVDISEIHQNDSQRGGTGGIVSQYSS
jgi:dUTP pyrophosphatase